MHRTSLRSFALGLTATAVTCAGGDATTAMGTRDTLPNGAERVRYTSLPGPPLPLEVDLRIGKVEGDGPDLFGDVRAIEADLDGNIYVLDQQASEIRVFDPAGEHLRTLSRRGEGPGEIGEANGMVFDAEGTLWV